MAESRLLSFFSVFNSPHSACTACVDAATDYIKNVIAHVETVKIHIEAAINYIKDALFRIEGITAHLEDVTAHV